jgi:hypothetical protein
LGFFLTPKSGKASNSTVVQTSAKITLNISEKTMKIRLVASLVGLAISFALPTLAQETSKPDPQLREELLALVKKFEDAWNNNDATALAAL